MGEDKTEFLVLEKNKEFSLKEVIKRADEAKKNLSNILSKSNLESKHEWENSGNHYDGLSDDQKMDLEWIIANPDKMDKEDSWYLIKNKKIIFNNDIFEEVVTSATNIFKLSTGEFIIVNKKFTLPL
ncbi:MAG: hypothetical protein KBT32_00995 [Bacteroidales bacterium]|nr:hypothetical protein [Candidatus Physcocola equi]